MSCPHTFTKVHISSVELDNMSLLERVEKLSNVDVDDPSTDVIKGLPFTPHNRKYIRRSTMCECLLSCRC